MKTRPREIWLIIIIVATRMQQKYQCAPEGKFFVTKLATTGGLLMSGNTTLLVGTNEENVDQRLILWEVTVKPGRNPEPSLEMFSSYPLEVQVGGATIFVIDIEKFIKL